MNKQNIYFTKGVTSLFLVLMVTFMADVSKAQTSSVKTNLANLIIGGGSLHYEHVLNDQSSAQLGAFFTSIDFSSTKFSGFGIIPQYRYYMGGKEVPHGFFIAPLVSFQTFKLESTTTTITGSTTAEANYTLIGGGVDVGQQWLINRNFSIELSVGAAFNTTNLEVTSSAGTQDSFDTGQFGSFSPRLGLSVGYAF